MQYMFLLNVKAIASTISFTLLGIGLYASRRGASQNV